MIKRNSVRTIVRTALGMLLCLACFACTQKSERRITSNSFFEYDAVDHYILTDTGEIMYPPAFGEKSKPFDDYRRAIILGNFPKSIADSTFVRDLKKIGYNKKQVSEQYFPELDKIFSYQRAFSLTSTACSPIYRDLLIFRNNNSIVGIAKICFECEQYEIVGSKVDTQNFGQNGEYELLQKILKQNALEQN